MYGAWLLALLFKFVARQNTTKINFVDSQKKLFWTGVQFSPSPQKTKNLRLFNLRFFVFCGDEKLLSSSFEGELKGGAGPK